MAEGGRISPFWGYGHALSSAARGGHVHVLRRLLSGGVGVDHVCEYDGTGIDNGFCLTPLQHVCKSGGRKNLEGRVACVKLLIERGACVDAGAPGNPGQSTDTHTNLTPLMYAVLRGYLDIVKMLLSAGADVHVLSTLRDGFRSSALTMSAFSYTYMRGDPRDTDAIVAALLKAGADANPAAFRQGTVMDFAIAHGRRRIWPLLLRTGAILGPVEKSIRPSNYDTHRTHPYLRKLDAAGGFKAHEKAHRATLQAIFAPKFTHLVPPELVARFLEFSFHLGFY